MRATVRENVDRVIDTTAGRVILNERLTRDGLPFVNGTLKKKGLQSLVSYLSPAARPRADRRCCSTI